MILPFRRRARLEQPAGKLCQIFGNTTKRPLFINLELSTSRYRLLPGEELVLLYEPSKTMAEFSASLRIDCIHNGPNMELVVWTFESDLYHTDGRVAEMNFNNE